MPAPWITNKKKCPRPWLLCGEISVIVVWVFVVVEMTTIIDFVAALYMTPNCTLLWQLISSSSPQLSWNGRQGSRMSIYEQVWAGPKPHSVTLLMHTEHCCGANLPHKLNAERAAVHVWDKVMADGHTEASYQTPETCSRWQKKRHTAGEFNGERTCGRKKRSCCWMLEMPAVHLHITMTGRGLQSGVFCPFCTRSTRKSSQNMVLTPHLNHSLLFCCFFSNGKCGPNHSWMWQTHGKW